MWITVLFDAQNNNDELKVIYSNSKRIYDGGIEFTFRTSQIFPIHFDTKLDVGEKYYIFFYNFDNPFHVIGKIINNDKTLRERIWYNIGLSSIILITQDFEHNSRLKSLIPSLLRTEESWEVVNENITNQHHNICVKEVVQTEKCKIVNYDSLSLVESSIIDEFVANINIIIPKIAVHNPIQLEVYYLLIEDVNELITELEYLKSFVGKKPDTLREYTKEKLKEDIRQREKINHQNIERIIQINSALSYISTQSLSGAVPILERRSLIRRHSLLGVGTAAMALNRISVSIESSFRSCSLHHIILDRMKEASGLPGLEDLLEYDCTNWNEYSIARWNGLEKLPRLSTKIPFFSGRLGFRETEYTISAAIQCVSSGAGLSWNLITITHEMVHSHVREILSKIFYGEDKSDEITNFSSFYDVFEKHICKQKKNLTLLESIRNLIFTYVCKTIIYGSITNEVNGADIKNNDGYREISTEFYLPNKTILWQQFQHEYRNINEIIVHVLDYHYFYASEIGAFVPLVWKSWVSLPYISGDLRQYILRTLLVISTEFKNSFISKRFESSVRKMNKILKKYEKDILNHSVIKEVINLLSDEDEVNKLLPSFMASIILVDLTEGVLLSENIRSELLNDELVEMIEDEDYSEGNYIYNLPEGFQESFIERPAAFLLDRYVKQLSDTIPEDEIESTTARYFLACNTYKL